MNLFSSKSSSETPNRRGNKIAFVQREPESLENTAEITPKNIIKITSQLKNDPTKSSSASYKNMQDYRKSRVKYSSINLNDIMKDQMSTVNTTKQSISPTTKQKAQPTNYRRGNLSLNIDNPEQVPEGGYIKKPVAPKTTTASQTSKIDFRKKRMQSLISNEPKPHSFTLSSPTKPIHTQDYQLGSTRKLKSVKNASVDHRACYSPGRQLKTEEPLPSRENQQAKLPPWSPQYVLDRYSTALSPYERAEIFKYKEIYYFGESNYKLQAHDEQIFVDERNDYKAIRYDHIAYRYEILDILGKGSFGQVLKVYDHLKKEEKALKIIRNEPKFHYQAKIEIKILKFMTDKRCGDHNIIEMEDYFLFRGHQCIIFDLLSINLYELIKANKYKGLSFNLLRRIAIQILYCLKFTRKHKIIHCDLKPENILLRYANKSGIRVIDFGSSCFESEKLYTYIQSRFYRSPEVILGLSYDTQIDMWSFGCLLAELYMGYPLFPGESEGDQLSCIMEIFGEPSIEVLQRATRRNKFFDEELNPKEFPNSKGKVKIPGTLYLNEVLRCREPSFVDLVEKCLAIDPQLRYTPDEALCHPWILEGLPENLQAQHLKLLQNDANKKDGGFMKENIVPVAQTKTTTEVTSRHEDNLGSNDESLTQKQEPNVKTNAKHSKNESAINVTINVDTQAADTTKLTNQKQIKSPQHNVLDDASNTTGTGSIAGSKSSGNINFINNIYYISNDSFSSTVKKPSTTTSGIKMSPKKQFIHQPTQNAQTRVELKLQQLISQKRDNSTEAESKRKAFTPKSFSSTSLRWRPNPSSRRENVKKNSFFPDLKKEL